MLACLVVPRGAWDLTALAGAVREHHPGWRMGAVWCGDPHLRPPAAAEVPWIDLALPEPTGAGWERLLVALPERAAEWARVAAALHRCFGDEEAHGGLEAAVVLRMGSVAVTGPLDPLVPEHGVRLVERMPVAPPADGLAPSAADLLLAGPWSDTVAGIAHSAREQLGWFGRAITSIEGGAPPSPGQWLDLLRRRTGGDTADPAAVHVLGWHTWVEGVHAQRRPGLLDLDALDRDEPWHVSFGPGPDAPPARLRLSEQPALAAAVESAAAQLVGRPQPLALPGGIAVDDVVRELMADAVAAWQRGEADLPPAPFGPEQSAFLRWLETPSPSWGAPIGRYWRALRTQRADLQAAFPRSDSADAARFAEWAEQSWRLEPRSVLVRPSVPSAFEPVSSVGFNPNGINVVGYLGFDASLGDVARRALRCLAEAHVPHVGIDHHRTASPRTADPPSTTRTAHFATNLAFVNADQFHFFVADHGPTLLAGRRTVAYWFWELEQVPAHMLEALAHVDEVWAGSTFVASAFAAVTDKPVRCVPLPVAEPQPSAIGRADLGLPAERFTFLVMLDYFSVAERKNPLGAIEAFRRAFPEPSEAGPVLVVKTVNGSRRWRQHERVLMAAAGRDDILVRDVHLPRADHMALVAAADCLVSLHRSEGLGLHCAEAMWLGKPVIATRWSGNVDFMDDSCSALVDATLVPVRHGEGVYPDTARWADPDLDQAATWMRRLVAEPGIAAQLGAAGRERMRAQPSFADTGRLIARSAGVGPLDPAAAAQTVAAPAASVADAPR